MKKILITIIILVTIAVLALAAWYVYAPKQPSVVTSPETSQTVQQEASLNTNDNLDQAIEDLKYID